MTENKRYIILDSPNTMPFICDRFENDKTIAEVHSDNVNQLCDLLNEKEEEITSLNSTTMELEDANARLEERINELENKLNWQERKTNELQERNDRQYDRLTHLWTCIENKDWETLTKEWEELEEADKKLQAEWKCL